MSELVKTWRGADREEWSVRLTRDSGTTFPEIAGLKIEEDDDEDYFAPLRSWSGSVTLLSRTAGLLGSLVARSAHDVAVEVACGGQRRWAGFVKPEALTQPFPGRGETVSLTLQGRLATAGGQYLDADRGRGFVTLGELMQEALLLCGFTAEDEVEWPSRMATAAGRPGLSVLGMQVSRGRFFEDSTEDSTEDGAEADSTEADVGGTKRTPYEVMTTAETVLGEVMKLFGYTLYERGGGVQVVCRGWTTYEVTTVGALTSPPSAPETRTYETETVSEDSVRAGDYSVSYVQGTKRVTVRSDLAPLTGNLVPAVTCEGRKFVGSYQRQLWPVRFAQGRGDAMLWTKVYELKDQAGDAVFAAFDGKATTQQRVENLSSWKDAEGKLKDDEFAPGDTYADFQRMGAFPAMVDDWGIGAIYNPPYDYDTNNKRDADFTEGFILNPARYECKNGADMVNPENDWFWSYGLGPFLELRNRNAVSWKGGAFWLTLKATVYYLNAEGDPGPQPLTSEFGELGFILRVGDYHYETGVRNGFTNVLNPDLRPVPLTMNATEGGGWPACETRNDKAYLMPYSGASGLYLPLQNASGVDLSVNGSLSFSLYFNTNFSNTSYPTLVFIQDFSLEYRRPDDEADANAAAGSYAGDSGTRTIYRRSRNGFDAEGHTVELMLSSQMEGASGCLSTLLKDGAPLETLWDAAAGADVRAEEALLGNLARDYDRIVERRAVRVRLGESRDTAGFLPQPGYRLPDDGRTWRLLAVAEDQAEGTATLTLMDEA